MGSSFTGTEWIQGRTYKGAEAAWGGRQGDQPGHGHQDQGNYPAIYITVVAIYLFKVIKVAIYLLMYWFIYLSIMDR